MVTTRIRGGAAVEDDLRGLQPVHDGHPGVHQHHVGRSAPTCRFGVAWWRHQRRLSPRGGRLWLLSPFGAAAARRVARTAPGALRGLPGLARALAPVILFCCGFFRAGLQVIGGLDPNATVNARGGPTYIGALACHYLDLGLIAGACGWLPGRILLPGRG